LTTAGVGAQHQGASTTESTAAKTILLLADTVIDPLNRCLNASTDAPRLRGIAAPYGQVYQALMDPAHEAWSNDPDYLLVWTIPALTLPSFQRVLAFEPVSSAAIMSEVETFADLVVRAASRVSLTLVTTWILPPHLRWVQTLFWKSEVGVANLLARANLLLAERFASHPNIVLLDANYWQTSIGPTAHDPRMYAIGKIFYSYALYGKAATEIKATIRGIMGLSKKVVVCDLDNTLWGGVAADDEMHNISLGPPNALGECYATFQNVLKALNARGILLSICSKNDEAFAMSVIENHPAMVLKKQDFVSWRINWSDKTLNLLSLAEELNLGLDSFVFLDDSPEERDQIRRLLPEVYVPDLPSSPAEYASFVQSLTCFEVPSLSEEDYARTAMYHAARDRRTSQDVEDDIEQWLRSLQLCVTAAPLSKASLTRTVQLLNKTNQFNLSVRRMEENEFWNWSQDAANAVYVFRVADKFGDLGLTGIASISRTGADARIVDFVMSCRVMGKKVEEAILAYVASTVAAMGVHALRAPATPTARNSPVVEFFQRKYSPGSSDRIDLALVAVPPAIQCVEEQ
jgi:FkbH-like protein